MDLTAIGRQFGLDDQQTRAAFDALAPVVAAGLRRNTRSDSGLADLIGALAGGNHARYIDDPSAYGSSDTIDDGNAILGHIFGSKDVSRGVAQQLSASSGIGESLLKKLLPIVATMVMGQIAKKTLGGGSPSSSGGGLGDILGEILGGGQTQPEPGGGGLGGILGSILGGGQPQASSAGGIEDMLKDILGGGSAPTPRQIEHASHGRRTIDDILGGGISRGTAADDLLNAVEQAIRRR